MCLPHAREWLASSIALALALSLVLDPAAALAQDDDDFLSDDYTSDDFLEEVYVEPEVEQEKGLAYWAFYVPADLLISRPFAVTDTAIGAALFVPSALVLAGTSLLKSTWDVTVGDGWYYDNGNLAAALQICLQDPADYLWNRPLGQLSSEY